MVWSTLTVGLGDMHAQNISERILETACILYGCMSLTILLTSLGKYAQGFKKDSWKSDLLLPFADWLVHKKVSKAIKKSALNQIRHIYENTPPVVEQHLDGLPPSFAGEVVIKTHSYFFSLPSPLSFFSVEFQHAISVHIKSIEFEPGDILCEISMEVQDIYFIIGGFFEAVTGLNPPTVEEELAGTLTFTERKGEAVGYYGAGSTPSLVAVINQTKETCTVRALSNGIAAMMDAAVFRDLLTSGNFDSDMTHVYTLVGQQREGRFKMHQATRSDTISAEFLSKSLSELDDQLNSDEVEQGDVDEGGRSERVSDVTTIYTGRPYGSNGFGIQRFTSIDTKSNEGCFIRKHFDHGLEDEDMLMYNDSKVPRQSVPFPIFPPDVKVWRNVSRTERLYQYTRQDIKAAGLRFASMRAFIANYYGINFWWLVGSCNVHKSVRVFDDETFHTLTLRGIGLPDAPAKIAWDAFIALLVLYTAVMVPMLLGFNIDDGTKVYVNIDYFVTSCFLWDILVTTRCTIKTPSAIPVDTVPSSVLKRNLFSGTLSFDLVSSVPWDYIAASVSGSDVSDLRVTRLVRMVRLLRLGKLYSRFLQIKSIYEFWLHNRLWVNLAVMAIQILYLCHFFACAFSFFINLGSDASREWWKTYIIFPLGVELDPTQPDEPTVLHRYLAAFYWSISVISTTGIGDIYPTTNSERIFTIIVIVFGVVLFAVFASKISSVVDFTTQESNMAEHGQRWHIFAKEHKISDSLRKCIASFHRANLAHESFVDPSMALETLPYYLRRKITLSSEKILIENLPHAIIYRHLQRQHPEIEYDKKSVFVLAEFAYRLVISMRQRWLVPYEDGFGSGGLGALFCVDCGSVQIGISNQITRKSGTRYVCNQLIFQKHFPRESYVAKSVLHVGEYFFMEDGYQYCAMKGEPNYHVVVYSEVLTKILIIDEDVYVDLVNLYKNVRRSISMVNFLNSRN